MRIAKLMMAMALATIASSAWAYPVNGKLVCAGTTKPVQGAWVSIDKTFEWGIDRRTDDAASDAAGAWGFVVPADFVGPAELYVDLGGGAGPVFQQVIEIAASYDQAVNYYVVEVEGVPGCEEEPPPVCEAVDHLTEGSFCLNKPIGNPRAECKYFGLEPLDKNDGTSGQTWTATTDAALAIVKSGNCYRTFVNVTKGETLYTPQGAGGISHVTYCACPE